jgi:serine/threonine protein kinase
MRSTAQEFAMSPGEETRLPADGAGPALLSFPCPACGKSLKLKGHLAGKKGKCPHCQAVVRIPTETTKTAASAPSSLADVVTQDGANTAARDSTDRQAPERHPAELTEFLAPAQAPDELGRLGPYRVLDVLGAGGMGVVFRAEDPALQRAVALKAMLPSLASSGTAKQRFLREARAAAALKHDNVVTIFQVGEDRGAPYLAMEFLEGEPLDARIKREGRLPIAEVLRIGREMAEGLQAAHEKGLIHRDIKPANVWLEARKGRVKILDFGLARAASGEQNLTQSGAIVGTPSYMAPEQAQGTTLDPRCDLFSLGCVLYRLATGELPFKGTDTISTLMAVATTSPRPPREVNPQVPAALSRLIMRLLAKKPDDRPASAQKVAEELEAIAAQPPAEKKRALDTNPPQKARQSKTGRLPATAPSRRRTAPAARSRTPLFIGAGVLLLIVPGVVFLLANTVFRVETPQGTLIVEIPDAEANNVQLSVRQGGQQVELLDLKTKKEVTLNAGAYQLELVGGKDGLRLETSQFELKRGGKQIARVIFQPRGKGRPPVEASGGAGAFFNGKDLTGWDGLPQYWSVKDGNLVGDTSSTGGAKFNTFLCSKRSYRDFELTFQVRLQGAKANSGVQIRSETFDANQFGVMGPQADMGEGYWGSLYGERVGGMMKKAPQEAQRAVKPDDFNDYSIRCVGQHVTITVNGQTTVDDDFPTLPATGILAWQLHAGPPMTVTFRNIRFKDLSAPPGPAAGGYRSLFNGHDLTGWMTLKGQPARWKVANGYVEVGKGDIETREVFGPDFELRADFWLPLMPQARGQARANSGIFLQGRYEVQILDSWQNDTYPAGGVGALYKLITPNEAALAKAIRPPEQWNSYRIFFHAPRVAAGKVVQKGRITIILNGVTIIEDGTFGTVTPGAGNANLGEPGPIRLQDHGAPVRFRNIQIRPIGP